MTKGFLGRRLSAILLAGAMLFALGGCGSSKTPISNVSSNPTAETTGLTESIDTTVSTDTAASTDTDTTASTDTTAATTPTKATTKATTTKATTTTTKAPTTTTKTPGDGKYTNPYGIYDVLKTYMGGSDLSERQLGPSVGYLVDGKYKDTMFDSFIFLPSPAHVHDGIMFADQSGWQNWIDNKTFLKGKNVNALEAVTADVKKAIGKSDYKAGVFLTLINPVPQSCRKFDKLNGKPVDFTKEDDRFDALKWMVDTYIATFNAQNYKNVKLNGFYWFDETIDVTRDKSLLKRITDYVRSKGYNTIFSAYYRASGYDAWKDCGFDLASMQSNYFPSAPSLPNAGGIDRLDTNLALTKLRGMGIELELDNETKKLGITGLKQTFAKGVQTGFIDGYHVYYFSGGPSAVYTVQRNRDPYFQSLYADTYKFIKGTLTMDDIHIELD